MKKKLSKLNAMLKNIKYKKYIKVDCGEWNRWINFASSMLRDPDFKFAQETIRGIREDIKEKQRITQPQKVALNNIYEGGSNKYRGERFYDEQNQY